jgi:hypothetical protein
MSSWYAYAALAIALLATSCASYKVPLSSFARERSGENAAHYAAVEEKALEHPLYQVIPRHRSQVRWLDAPHWIWWSLAGNDDNGIFGESKSVPYSTNIHAGTFFRWNARNPLHNFTFYTVGSAHWKHHYNAIVLSVGDNGVRVFSTGKKAVFDTRNSFKIAFNDFKPFVSCQFSHFKGRLFQFYVGWRERGNLGFKLRPWAKPEKRKDPGSVEKTSCEN